LFGIYARKLCRECGRAREIMTCTKQKSASPRGEALRSQGEKLATRETQAKNADRFGCHHRADIARVMGGS
jgi:hypothetical protein